MPRAKRASDEVYNARRRLKRQAARMERDAAKIEDARLRSAALSYAQSLRETAERARGRMTEEQRAQALEVLATVRERTKAAAYSRDARVRSNLIFAQQINAAGMEGAETTLNVNATKAFWVANKGLWTTGEHVPRNERYGRILAEWYGGSSNAQRLSDWIVEQRKKKLERELEQKLGRKLTEEEREGLLSDHEREQLLAESQGSLQLVYEFIAYQLEQDEHGLTDLPELDYERVKKSVYVAH